MLLLPGWDAACIGPFFPVLSSPYLSTQPSQPSPHTTPPPQVTYEEMRVEAAVRAAAEGAGARLRAFWANTLAHLEDLPFKLAQLPQNFGARGVAAASLLPHRR